MRAASYCDVTLIYYSDTVSMDAFIITMALSARAIQHGAHRHDRRGIYRCVLFRFRSRIEIDHSYGLRCRGLCCHSRHSTRGPAGRKRPRDGRPTRAVPGVAAQSTPAQTVSWSISIASHYIIPGMISMLRCHLTSMEANNIMSILSSQWDLPYG